MEQKIQGILSSRANQGLLGVGLVLILALGSYFYYYNYIQTPYADQRVGFICEDEVVLTAGQLAKRQADLRVLSGQKSVLTRNMVKNLMPEGCRLADQSDYPQPGDCKILKQEHCDVLFDFWYGENPALGFMAPEDMPVFAPTDGLYFDNRDTDDPDEPLTRIEFWLMDSDSHILFDGLFKKHIKHEGQYVREGEVIGYMYLSYPIDPEHIGNDAEVNFVVVFSDTEMQDLVY